MNEPQPAAMPPQQQTPKPEQQVVTSTGKSNKKSLRMILTFLLALVLLAGAAYGGYWWRDRDAKADNEASASEIALLKKKISDLEKNSADTTDTTDSTDETETSVQPTAEQLENIQASITSGNTAALEGRMADAVTVVIAASEGLGSRTPAQAIGDLDYVVSLSATWDFNLSEATLTSYAAGDYAQYFPDGALVGKSSEDKVVSFIFDSNAKIKTVFMSATSDIL